MNNPTKLSDLLQVIPEADRLRIEDVDVSSVTDHSGQVEQDSVFVAVRGSEVDGHDFLDQVMLSMYSMFLVQRWDTEIYIVSGK